MPTPPCPDQLVRDAVSRADRQRRARLATRALARLSPVAAGLGLLVAAAARLGGWPVLVPVLVLAALAVSLLIDVILRRRPREASDAIAASVDAAAGLSGELRSAHWFATNQSDDPWTTYHLARAAGRVADVEWAALYPPVRATRAWMLTAVLAVGALALVVRMPVRAATPDSLSGGVRAGRETAEMSAELQKRLEELLAAMEAGKISDKEMRASLDQLKDLMARLDPELQKKLAELAKLRPLGADAQTKRRDLDEEDRAANAERGEMSSAGLPEDVRWALEDLAARLASASLDRKTAESNPAASSETGELGRGSAQAEMAQAKGETSTQLLREAAKDPGAAQMMMGGGGMMGGDSQAGAGGNSGAKTGQADPKSIARALRRELIEASADARGENVPIEDIRRKTEQGRSALEFSRAVPLATFDRSRAAAPPTVPVARQPLLFNYFIRKQ